MIILITGGARSGKSAFAQKLATELGKRVLFCATAQPLDPEMQARIEMHRKSRPAGWDTVELPLNVAAGLRHIRAKYDIIVIDCITMLVANRLCEDMPEEKAEYEVLAEIEPLISYMQKQKIHFILVTNEVGWGIVPDNKLARLYRDLLGKVNQKLAGCAHEVYLLVAGIPCKIK